ncbi:hypothetical protein B0H13DRAFT_2371349 [Mycena leptocephala]|nr:hypothetical protein B0H13DRAFT_2371349 [Mycena leptocephala]
MADLRPLLEELRTRIMVNSASGILHQMDSPLAALKTTMEQFTEKLKPGDARFAKLSKRLTWTLWDKKEAKEYLDKLEGFKSLLNSWLLVDIWAMGQHHNRDQNNILQSVNNIASLVDVQQRAVINMGHRLSEQQRLINAMGPTVNVMITSRPHITQDPCLPLIKTLEIRAKDDDVRRYLDEHIRMSSRLSRHVKARPELRDDIHATISRTVDGMFQLAKLHIESLSKKSTVKANYNMRVRVALAELPGDLQDTYENAMKRIEDQNEDRKLAHSVLTWVANAKRLLTVSELQTALAIEPDTRELDRDNINLLDIETILSVCTGLVIVDQQLSVVRLVDYTTQEYLDGIRAQRFPRAQTNITRSVLTYLTFTDLLWTYPESWDARDGKRLRGIFLIGLNIPPHWIAVAANLLETSKFLLDAEISSLHSCTTEPGVLQVVSYDGHFQMVKLLLEHGADINARQGWFGSALNAASFRGHELISRLLLDNGADVNLQNEKCGSPLQLACSVGHEKIIQVLLDSGADVSALGGRYGNALQAALHAASSGGSENIVQLLLDNGADVNAKHDSPDSTRRTHD